MSPATVPLSNGTTSFWRTKPDELDNHRSSDALPKSCDVVVIGAGYAGASVVHHILKQSRRDSAPSMVILEARQACSGATGRNGGHMKPDPYNSISRLAAEHGLEAASEVAAFEASHVTAIKDLVDEEGIDCDYVVTSAMDVQLSPAHCEAMKTNYDRLVARGCRPTTETEFVDKQDAEQRSGVKGAAGCFVYQAGHMWPYKFIMHLLRRALASGHVNLQTHTPVTKVSENEGASSHRWLVQTARGSVATQKVVFATNGYTSSLLPQYRDVIVPVRGTCSRIVVPNRCDVPRLTNSYTIRWNSWDYDYLVPRHDGSIVVGGARSSFVHQQDGWYNVTDDSRVLASAERYFDDYMQRTFQGWENSGAYTDRVWTGIMGYSMDGLPHVGTVPNAEPGQYIVAGFTGHGMPQVFLAAEGLARMVLGDVPFENTSLPRLFKARPERLHGHAGNRHLDALPRLQEPQAHL